MLTGREPDDGSPPLHFSHVMALTLLRSRALQMRTTVGYRRFGLTGTVKPECSCESQSRGNVSITPWRATLTIGLIALYVVRATADAKRAQGAVVLAQLGGTGLPGREASVPTVLRGSHQARAEVRCVFECDRARRQEAGNAAGALVRNNKKKTSSLFHTKAFGRKGLLMRVTGEQEKRQMFVLRRTKETTVKDRLTTKRDNIVFCTLSEYQKRAYERFTVSARAGRCDACVGLPSS